MNSCDDCGKVFKYPYILLRHLNRKIPCSSNKNLENNENVSSLTSSQNENVSSLTSSQNDKVSSLGTSEHICNICNKHFKFRQGLFKHKKFIKCIQKKSILELEDEIESLRNELLHSKTVFTTINNNNAKTINSTINKNHITYNIIYNPETRCLTTDDPNAPSSELLCFNGFKLEAARTKLKDIDQDILQRLITNVREHKDFISFYTFFFRNIDNKRMHMFTLGKNNNTTHAHVFNNGNIEKIDKLQLFDNVCKYIGQYLLNKSIENTDVIHMLTSEQASKNAFVEVMRDNSNIFDYFKKNELLD